ncbi:MAG TPA: ABC transporter permease [Chloroflexota bacterium]|jgi:peptide/nickel transport system permease protein
MRAPAVAINPQTVAVETPHVAGFSARRGIRWHRFREHRLAAVALPILVLLVVAVLCAPLSPYNPDRSNLPQRLQAPSLAHPFGTDDLGRDELTRTLVGGRISLAVGLLAVFLSLTIGLLSGAPAGYFGGLVDSLLMRLTEAMLAIPQLFVLILLAVFFGTSFGAIVLIIGLLRWMSVARLVRASFLQHRGRDYVLAARALGASTPRLMWRHILPNTTGPVIVAATLGIGAAILTESALSFLGLGIQLPTASWGNMLRTSQATLTTAPWLALAPGGFIFASILCINYVGDGLRDALDPHGP